MSGWPSCGRPRPKPGTRHLTITEQKSDPDRPRAPAHSRRRRRRASAPGRRWSRRLLVATNIVVALCLVSSAVVYGYVRYRVSQLKTIRLPSLTKVVPGASGSGGPAAMNILLVGSNTRTGLAPNE